MGRLLFLIALAVLVLYVWRSLTARANRPESRREAGANQPEKIVACARCGVHVPASEAVRDGDDVFCCAEHRRLGKR